MTQLSRFFVLWAGLISGTANSLQAQEATPGASLPFEVTGGPGLRFRVSRPDSQTVRFTASGPGRRPVREEVTLRGQLLGRVETTDAAHFAVLHAQGREGHAAALVVWPRSGLRIAWTGRLDYHGDPGERWADVLRIEEAERGERDRPAASRITVGLHYEPARVCGQPKTLLVARHMSSRGHLGPPAAPHWEPSTDAVQVNALSNPPSPPRLPTLRGLGFRAASSSQGHPPDPRIVPAPTALTDGRIETAWTPGTSRGGEFVTGRFRGGSLSIRSFSLTFQHASASHVWLVGDRGPALRVQLPTPVPLGQPLWIEPPQALRWRCVSLVLGKGTGAARPSAVAELHAYTSLDFGGGVSSLVERLENDGPVSAEAERLLAELGAVAVKSIRDGWPALGARARRRAVRVLGRRGQIPEALALLSRAAADPDARVRSEACRELQGLGPTAGSILASVASSSTYPATADRAAAALARADPARAVPFLLSRTGERASRTATRRALRAAVAAWPEGSGPELERWLKEEPSPSNRAIVAAALAPVAVVGPWVAALIQDTAARARRFEDRWWLVQAAAALKADPAADRWLINLATEPTEWMIRRAALESLHRRKSPDTAATALRLAHDPYPRVRAAAARILGDFAPRPEVQDRLIALLRKDPWSLVRAATIDVLGRARVGSAHRAVSDRLVDASESPRVVSSALRFARKLCLQPMVPAIIDRLGQETAVARRVEDYSVAALALNVLADLGGASARTALLEARTRGPEPVRQAARHALRRPRACPER